MSSENGYILEMNNITKRFPGVLALDKVTLKVKPGTVHALMGENGAGKSTLMKCLFGIYVRDEGDVILDGQSVNFSGTLDAIDHRKHLPLCGLQVGADRGDRQPFGSERRL